MGPARLSYAPLRRPGGIDAASVIMNAASMRRLASRHFGSCRRPSIGGLASRSGTGFLA